MFLGSGEASAALRSRPGDSLLAPHMMSTDLMPFGRPPYDKSRPQDFAQRHQCGGHGSVSTYRACYNDIGCKSDERAQVQARHSQKASLPQLE